MVDVFPTTIAILVGLNPLSLLVCSQVILSLLMPLLMIRLVYYTSRRKFMGEFVNRRMTTIAAIAASLTILSPNVFLLLTL